MKKEITIHFNVIHHDRTSLLRGIIFLEENQKPTLTDYQQCLMDCGHQVVLIDKEHVIFKASKPGEDYLIHVLDEEENGLRDVIIENLAKNLLKTQF